MKKTGPGIGFLAALTFIISDASSVDNGLWVEGKDRPQARVNVGMKSVAPDAYLKIAEKFDSAVVNISTTKVIKRERNPFFRRMVPRRPREEQGPPSRGPNPFEEFFDQFLTPPSDIPEGDLRQQSLGSGFILNSDGYVITNDHVIDLAEEIRVVLNDESEYVAKVIGRDPRTDVALLKIDAKRPLSSVVIGDSDDLKVGDIVVAIGNPFGLSHSLTHGIVSAKERSIGFGNYDDFIQTDASINPGNSGGPLLNFYGEVVGINTAIVSSGQGIGFAIPINLAKTVLPKLRETGKVVRGWLGVHIQKVTDEHAKAFSLRRKEGALVSQIADGSPAEKAGIKPGDVITKFSGKDVKDWRDLPLMVANSPVKSKATVEVIRDGQSKTVQVEVGELPEETKPNTEAAPQKTADKLGLRVDRLTPELARALGIPEGESGVVVSHVEQDSPAFEKGIRQGDVIKEINRAKISSLEEYKKEVDRLKEKSTVLLLVKRQGSTVFIAFTL